ncbi:MAG TPA: condensation domain-containing protein, partial [Steroidobacter sp.]|nr:condensation domain-containing protein [Steroidobacter sp.]
MVTAASHEQGPVEGEVALTPIQHWFFDTHLDEPHHFNQAFLLTCTRRLRSTTLDAVIKRLAQHHDALRLRFEKVVSGWRQVNAAHESTGLQHIDLSHEPDRQRALAEKVQSLQESLSLARGPIFRVALIELGANEPQRLLLVIHHLAVDGVSWRILLADLRELYEVLEHGTEAELPAKTSSFKRWSESLLALRDSPLLLAEERYWRDQPWDTVTALPQDFSGVNSISSEQGVTVALDQETTRALLQEVPEIYRTQINDVLLACLWEAFGRWTHGKSLLIDLEGHGREAVADDLDLTRTVGWFTSICPVLLTAAEADPELSINLVKDRLRGMQQRAVAFGVLKYLKKSAVVAAIPAPQVRFNYLGQMDADIADDGMFSIAPEGSGIAHSSKGTRSHLIGVDSIIIDGCLQSHWSFSTAMHLRSTIEAVASDFVTSLRTLIEQCRAARGSVVPADFPLINVSHATLERIVASSGGARAVSDIYPLSPLQHGLIFQSMLSGQSGVYVTGLRWFIRGRLDVEVLRKAWQHVLDRHDVLRSSFVGLELETALQVVHRRV